MTKKQSDAKIAWENKHEKTLLPCAHCGQKAIIVQWRDTKNPNATWVACQNPSCGMMTDSHHDKNRERAAQKAIAVWNKRTCPPEIKAAYDAYIAASSAEALHEVTANSGANLRDKNGKTVRVKRLFRVVSIEEPRSMRKRA